MPFAANMLAWEGGCVTQDNHQVEIVFLDDFTLHAKGTIKRRIIHIYMMTRYEKQQTRLVKACRQRNGRK